MVKLCENADRAFEQVQRARFVRRRPSGKQRVAPNVALLLIRARYYDPMTGEFTSRDPLEYLDGMSLYRGYMGTERVDPFGMAMLPHEEMEFDDYWDWWKERHPDLTLDEFGKRRKTLALGCVGITLVNSGYSTIGEVIKNCYPTKAEAETAQSAHACGAKETARLFSVHYWWSGTALPRRSDGTLDLDPWHNGGRPRGRSAGDWDGDGIDESGGVNFDFGWMCDDGATVLHADMYDNPDNDGDGTGDYFPTKTIRVATVFGSTLDEWTDSYSDFNSEVWCVVCQKEDAKCTDP